MGLVRLLAVLLLASAAASVAGAPPASQEDPFSAAAARAAFPVLAPASAPPEFVLAGVELIGNPPDTLLATYHAPDGRSLFLMEGDPEGLACPDCRETVAGAWKASYRADRAEDGSRLLSLVFVADATGVSIGLRDDGTLPESEALRLLQDFGASLRPAARGEAPAGTANEPLLEAARKASFPVYAPAWLPRYFTLKSISYLPPGGSDEGGESRDEQVALVYEDSLKSISLAIRGPGRVALPSGQGARKVAVGSWPAVLLESEGRRLLVISAGDASILLTGTVQEDTLLRVARSLRPLRTEIGGTSR